jgi:hypothetical protein
MPIDDVDVYEQRRSLAGIVFVMKYKQLRLSSRRSSCCLAPPSSRVVGATSLGWGQSSEGRAARRGWRQRQGEEGRGRARETKRKGK